MHTYDVNSVRGTMDLLDMNISTTLTKLRPGEYIESVVVLTLLRNINMNGAILECNHTGYTSDREQVSVNSLGKIKMLVQVF